jgi:hypothetical protein
VECQGVDEVEQALAAMFAEPFNVWLLCWQGASLTLEVREGDEPVDRIDLRPHVVLRISGCPDLVPDEGPAPDDGIDWVDVGRRLSDLHDGVDVDGTTGVVVTAAMRAAISRAIHSG